jgi:hypothetical protein
MRFRAMRGATGSGVAPSPRRCAPRSWRSGGAPEGVAVGEVLAVAREEAVRVMGGGGGGCGGAAVAVGARRPGAAT